MAVLLPMDSALPGQDLNFLAFFFFFSAKLKLLKCSLPEVMLQLAVTKA